MYIVCLYLVSQAFLGSNFWFFHGHYSTIPVCCSLSLYSLLGAGQDNPSLNLCTLGFTQYKSSPYFCPLGANQPNDLICLSSVVCSGVAALFSPHLQVFMELAGLQLMLFWPQAYFRQPCAFLVLSAWCRANQACIHHPHSQPSTAAMFDCSGLLLGNRLVDLSSLHTQGTSHGQGSGCFLVDWC